MPVIAFLDGLATAKPEKIAATIGQSGRAVPRRTAMGGTGVPA